MIPSRNRTPVVVLATLILITCAIILLSDPFAADSLMPPCLFHALTHFYCPGCGVTRAVHALLHGHLSLALSMNPLAVLAIPLIPVMLWNTARPGTVWMARASDGRAWLALVIAFFILRNMPWPPFLWLAPG